MSVIIYTKDNCTNCDNTKRFFKKYGVTEWEEVDIMLPKNAEKLNDLKEKGHLQAPIVEAGGEIWSGFRVDKIKAFAKAKEAAVVA